VRLLKPSDLRTLLRLGEKAGNGGVENAKL